MQRKLHIVVTSLIVLACGLQIAPAWEQSRLSALAARQKLQDKVSVAMADGRISIAERTKILADARNVLSPDEYPSFEQALDRLSPAEEEQPRNIVQKFKSNRTPLLTMYWPQTVFSGTKRPMEQLSQITTMLVKRRAAPSQASPQMIAEKEERVLPDPKQGEVAAEENIQTPASAPMLLPEATQRETEDLPAAPLPETVRRQPKESAPAPLLNTARAEPILPIEPIGGTIIVVTGMSDR